GPLPKLLSWGLKGQQKSFSGRRYYSQGIPKESFRKKSTNIPPNLPTPTLPPIGASLTKSLCPMKPETNLSVASRCSKTRWTSCPGRSTGIYRFRWWLKVGSLQRAVVDGQIVNSP